jgi:hypothetical protein
MAIGVPSLAATEPPRDEVPSGAPFLWRDVEDEDYRIYIANLRAAGCPEVVIRNLVAAELAQAFTARAAEIWRPRRLEYWRKYEPERDGRSQTDWSHYTMLLKEHGALLDRTPKVTAAGVWCGGATLTATRVI